MRKSGETSKREKSINQGESRGKDDAINRELIGSRAGRRIQVKRGVAQMTYST